MHRSRRKIKVLHFLNAALGGSADHVLTLLKSMDREKYDFTVAFAPGNIQDREFYELDCKIFPVKMSRGISAIQDVRAFVQILKLIRRERFDIVETHTSVPGVLGRLAAWLCRSPVNIFMMHAFASHAYQPSFKKKLFLHIERFMDIFTTYYIAGSNFMKQEAIRKGIAAEDKVSVINYSISPDKLNVPIDGSVMRQKLGLPSDAKVIGTAARLEPQKGLPHFLEAAALVAREIPDAVFYIGGDGPMLSQLERLSRELGIEEKVIFGGWRDDIVEVINMYDIFCLPSLWEAFGIVFLEAMYLKKPVVATRVDGIPEVVADGETGFLVPPQNPQAIADALIRLLKDDQLCESLGERGHLRVKNLFLADHMAAAHDELYSRLLNARHNS